MTNKKGVGSAWVINGRRAITSAREIRRGRNKGNWEVILLCKFKGKKKHIVEPIAIKEMPK